MPDTLTADPETTEADSESPALSIEDRLSAIEATLADRDSTIRQQAAQLALAAENASRLRVSRLKVDRLKDRMQDAKEAATEATNNYKAAVEEHFGLEKELDTGQQRLPLSDPDAGTAESKAEVDAAFSADGHGCVPAIDDNAWRAVLLSDLGIENELPQGIIDALGDRSRIWSVGELSDYLAPKASGFTPHIHDLPGIGKAKAEKIEAALDAFWARWAARDQVVVEAGDDEPGEDEVPPPTDPIATGIYEEDREYLAEGETVTVPGEVGPDPDWSGREGD